jgi:hypothetical protein
VFERANALEAATGELGEAVQELLGDSGTREDVPVVHGSPFTLAQRQPGCGLDTHPGHDLPPPAEAFGLGSAFWGGAKGLSNGSFPPRKENEIPTNHCVSTRVGSFVSRFGIGELPANHHSHG